MTNQRAQQTLAKIDAVRAKLRAKHNARKEMKS